MKKTHTYYVIANMQFEYQNDAIDIARELGLTKEQIEIVTQEYYSSSVSLIEKIKAVREYDKKLITWNKLTEEERLTLNLIEPKAPADYDLIKKALNQISLNTKMEDAFDSKFLSKLWRLWNKDGKNIQSRHGNKVYTIQPFSQQSTVSEFFEILKLVGGPEHISCFCNSFGPVKINQLNKVVNETGYKFG